MNKLERRLKGESKFKKRLKNHGITEKSFDDVRKFWGRELNVFCYKTTGKPCSCPMCSPGKISEKAKYRVKHKHRKFDD
jgi:hypothetical protein